PPYSLPPEVVEEIKRQSKLIARELKVKGLVNLQFAVKEGEVYVLEVNPRASRTVPFVSKTVGYPLAKLSALVGVGESLRSLVPEVFERLEKGLAHPASDFMPLERKIYSVKEVVFPWRRFPEEDPVLGPEMKSTGEVMGIGECFGLAYYKAQLAAGNRLPTGGKVFISVADRDKPKVVELAEGFLRLGFEVCATLGTYNFLKGKGLEVRHVLKVSEGRPNVVDMIKNQEVNLVINTPTGRRERSDAYHIRRSAVQHRIAYTTTVRGGYAMLEAIRSYIQNEGKLKVYALQDL
ncbi:MAG: carbamoyl-phosphate synthase large chain, partial [Aquificaceae bacterium]|nr:carbamoyl-phosphate synthase large chain [Aquificaceae bacterium]